MKCAIMQPMYLPWAGYFNLIAAVDTFVFLDDVQNEPAVRQQLARLADAARSHGVAVGIGHMYPVTMKVLAEEVPHLRAEGIRFVRASQAVR